MSAPPPPKPPSPVDTHRNRVGTGTYNRYGPLFPGVRTTEMRTPTRGKRPLDNDDLPSPAVKVPRFDSEKVFDQLRSHDTLLNNAKSLLKEARDGADSFLKIDDNGIGTFLFKLTQVCENLISGQESLKSTLVDAFRNGSVSGLPTEKSQQGKSTGSRTARPPPPPAETAKAKVKKVLREAERRTLVFDLNLGSTPVMNKETISKKVTMDLHNKAKEGKHDWALESAATMVDDLLSCAQLEFLGGGTRKFYNNRDKEDARNNRMCTVPVRFDFRTKEQRLKAEQTLRKVCGAKCSVPYPKKLRALLADLVKEGKAARPNSFIMTKVDIDNLAVQAFARGENGWIDLNLCKNIPLDIADTTAITTITLDDDRMSESQQIS